MCRHDRGHSAGGRGGQADHEGSLRAACRLEPLSRGGVAAVATVTKIATTPDFVFDALVDGPADAPLVLFLHGFAESFHTWHAQIAAVAAAGHRALAPSQRGYSVEARPDPREARSEARR